MSGIAGMLGGIVPPPRAPGPPGPPGPGGPDPQSPEELLALLEELERHAAAGGNMEGVPPDITELLRKVKKEKGVPVEEEVPTEEVVPEPAFVVKTTDALGRKVFVNVCGHERVPAPGTGWAGGLLPDEVQAALDNLDSLQAGQAEALRFPLSLGPVRSETDKQGQACVVYDVVLNAEVLTAASRLRALKLFLIELALQWIGSKATPEKGGGGLLDRRFKLPKMRYKGDLPPPGHRIRSDDRKRRLVTEITELPPDEEAPTFALRTSRPSPPAAAAPGAAGAAMPAAAAGGASSPAAASPAGGGFSFGGKGSAAKGLPGRTAADAAFDLQHTVEYEGRPVSAVLVVVQVPAAALASGVPLPTSSVRVEVCGRTLHVAVPRCPELAVLLPFAVAGEGEEVGGRGTEALWDAKEGRLRLRLPVLPLRRWVAAMQAEAPLAFGDVRFENRSFLELEP